MITRCFILLLFIIRGENIAKTFIYNFTDGGLLFTDSLSLENTF